MSAERIQQIYIALFNRPADPVGLDFWLGQTNQGADLAPMLDVLASLPEYQDRFNDLSDAQKINSIYQALFGRDADFGGLTYFAGQLGTGALTLATLAVNILDGAQGSDATIIANKVTASNNFTEALDTGAEVLAYAGAAGITAGTTYLSGITSDAATVPDATATAAAVTTLVESNSGTTGSTFTLTDSADSLTGTSGDDTFVASTDNGNASVAAGDTINGGAGTDRLNVFTDANIGAINTIGITNLEQIYAQFDGTAGADTLDVSAISGLTQAWVSKGVLNGADVVKLTKAQTAGIEGTVAATTAATDTLTFNFSDATAGTSDSASLALSSADMSAFTLATGGVVIDAIETLSVSATGTNKLGTLDSDSVSTLNVTGAGSLSFTDGAQGSTFKTIAAADNTGGVNINLAALAVAQDHTITTGSGSDVITNLWANQSKADTIDLGAGEDKLIFTDAVTISNATQAEQISKVSNVEELAVDGAVALTVDGDLVSQTKFEVDGTGIFALTDLANGSTLTFGDATTAGASTAGMKLGANTLNINLEGGKAAASDVTAGLTVTGSATINVASSGTEGIANNVLALTAADNQSVVLTGSQNTTLTTTAAPGTTGFSIDATAFTGKGTITGTAAADIIKGGTAADTISGGAGAVGDTLTGGAGADTFVLTVGLAGTTEALAEAITDFTSGSDKLKVGVAGSATNYSEAGSAVADFATALAAANTALDTTVLFNAQQVGSDTFLFLDSTGTGSATEVVKLIGVALDGVAQADFIV